MICPTLTQLYQICADQRFGFSPADMIRVACRDCQSTEVCPTMSAAEYDSRTLVPQVDRSIGLQSN